MKTPSAAFQSVVQGSFNIAHELHSGIITSVHILGAILQQKEDKTAQAILRLTADSEILEQSIRSEALTHGKSVPDKYKKSPRKVPSGSLPMSDEAEAIIAGAMKVSARANETANTRHIVACILDNQESFAHVVLKGQLDVQRLRLELSNTV